MGVQVRCLGRLRLGVDGEALREVPATRAGEVLACLALQEDATGTRAQLATTLWPDTPEEAARRRLRQALWELRRRHGLQAYLRTEGELVALGPAEEVYTDVQTFAALARRDEPDALAEAAATYRGELLEGWLQEWVLPQRRWLRGLAVDVLARLVGSERAAARYERALDYARRRAAMASLDEEAHRDVMRLCAVLGRWNEGLRQAARCREIVREELGLGPTADTEALAGELRAGRERDDGPAGAAPPTADDGSARDAGGEREPALVGRVRERRALIAQLEETLAGRGGTVFLEGPAGIGKTCLLREVAQDARWRGLAVAWTEGHEPARREPYRLLARAFAAAAEGEGSLRMRRLRDRLPRAWWGDLAAVVPAFGQVVDRAEANEAVVPYDAAQHETRWTRLRMAFGGMVRAYAEMQSLLLVVDDAQWADAASLHVLADVARQDPPPPLLMVLSYRGREARRRRGAWRAAKRLDAEAAGPPLRLALEPLHPDEVHRLVQRELGGREDVNRLAASLHHRTGGHPLFVLALLRTLRQQGERVGTAGRTREGPSSPFEAGPDDALVPDALQALIRRERRQLAPPSRRLLDVLAVIAEPCDDALIEVTADGSREEAYAGLEELLRWRWVRQDPEGWCVRHDLLRSIAYRAMHGGRRRELHARVADAWEAKGAKPANVLAPHLARAGRWRAATDAYRRAADEAVDVQAYDDALHHVREAQRAALRATADDEARFELLSVEEDLLHVLARRPAQGRVLAAMARTAGDDRHRCLMLHVRRARAWVRTGRPGAARAEADQAVALAEGQGSLGLLARALEARGIVAHEAGRAREALPALERAADGFERSGDRRRAAEARRRLGAVHAEVQDYDGADVQLCAAENAFRTLGDRRGEASVWARLGVVQRQRGRIGEAEASYRRALERFQQAGDRWAEAQVRTNLGLVSLALGRVGAGLAQLDTAVAMAGEIGERRGQAIARANAASVRQAVLGENQQARAGAEAARDALDALGDVRLRNLPELVIANAELDDGAPARGRARLEEVLAACRAAGHGWLEAQVGRDLARAHLLHGQPASALPRVDEALSRIASLGLATLEVEVRALRGRALVATGRPELAMRETEAARVALHEGVNRAYLVPFAHHLALAACGNTQAAAHAIADAERRLAACLADLPEDRRERALHRVPEHRALRNAYRAYWPVRRDVALPPAGPDGQRGGTRRRVPVTWTVSDPDDLGVGDRTSRRRRRLARLLAEAHRQGAAPTIVALADAVGASASTVKRDLARLRRSGHAP